MKEEKVAKAYINLYSGGSRVAWWTSEKIISYHDNNITFIDENTQKMVKVCGTLVIATDSVDDFLKVTLK